MISREFLAQRVFDLTKPKLAGQYNDLQIWKAIAETSDDELYSFYHRLVEDGRSRNERIHD